MPRRQQLVISIEHAVINGSRGPWLEYNALESENEEPIFAENVTESESRKDEEKNVMISYEPKRMMICAAKEYENYL